MDKTTFEPAPVIDHKAPPAAEPNIKPSETRLKDAKSERKSAIDGIFDAIGKDEKPPEEKPPEPKAEEKPPEPKPEEKPPEEKPPEKPRSILDDDEEIDFDKPPAAEEKPTEEPEKLAEPDTRAMATLRDQLQIQGRRAKELAVEVKERDMEIDRLRAEISSAEEKLNAPERVAADPFSHPDVIASQKRIKEEQKSFARQLSTDERAAFNKEFEGMLSDYVVAGNAANPQAEDQLIDDLREKIGATVGDDQVASVMKLLAANSGEFVDLREKIANFGDLAVELKIKNESDKWAQSAAKTKAVVRSLVEVDDAVIEADPHTPAAYVAALVKKDPAYAKRSEQAQAVIVEAFYGKRPLSKDELETIRSGEDLDGIKLDTFTKERDKIQAKLKDDAVKRLYTAMMVWPDLHEMIKGRAVSSQKEEAAEAEKAALLTSTRNKDASPKPKEEKVERWADQPSAISKVLDKF